MGFRLAASLLVSLAMFASAVPAQNSVQDLPSAPSAARQSAQPQPAPTPPNASPEQKPAAVSAGPAAGDPAQPSSAQAGPSQNAAPMNPPPPSTQSETPPPDESIATIRKTVNEVHVVFT